MEAFQPATAPFNVPSDTTAHWPKPSRTVVPGRESQDPISAESRQSKERTDKLRNAPLLHADPSAGTGFGRR